MILIIDNYDSFVHNLGRHFRQLGFETHIVRNDKITLSQITEFDPTHIILSPGPCTPNEAGICVEVVKRFSGSVPILGVCLGHQAIAAAFGGKIVKAIEPVHGKAREIRHHGTKLFAELSETFMVGRYHSLIIEEKSLPNELIVTAKNSQDEIMSIEHRIHPTVGVQFHPESIMTDYNYELLKNFFKYYGS